MEELKKLAQAILIYNFPDEPAFQLGYLVDKTEVSASCKLYESYKRELRELIGDPALKERICDVNDPLCFIHHLIDAWAISGLPDLPRVRKVIESVSFFKDGSPGFGPWTSSFKENDFVDPYVCIPAKLLKVATEATV